MPNFDRISRDYAALPYMDEPRAALLRSIMREQNARSVLEIGFYHGKSSLYIAAILEDFAEGHLFTIDKASSLQRDPNINTLLHQTGLAHRVSVRATERSYTWELQRLISDPATPKFDLCYFDGGHMWDTTGFGVLLVDMLMKDGGTLILDDMNWSLSTSAYHQSNPKTLSSYAEDERAAMPVRLTWDTILPHLGYQHIREYPAIGWGLARKTQGPTKDVLPLHSKSEA